MAEQRFKRYFTLEEAVAELPDIRFDLEQARKELAPLRDDIVLTKRLMAARYQHGRQPSEAEIALLGQKYEAFEAAASRWVHSFAEKGIILRNINTGLLDFPYRSRQTQQEYLLCWQGDEDGIFYFHGLQEGFAGRYPITLLPD